MLVNDNVQHFLGKANPTFLLLNSRSLGGGGRGGGAASTGSVLATIGNIANALKIKPGHQYREDTSRWKTPALTPNVDFFHSGDTGRVTEMRF